MERTARAGRPTSSEWHDNPCAPFRRFGERATEGIGDRFIELRKEVSVAVERDVDRRVANSRLDHFGVGAGGDCERDARVSKVVEPTRHRRGGLRPPEVVREEARRRQWTPGRVREHQGIGACIAVSVDVRREQRG